MSSSISGMSSEEFEERGSFGGDILIGMVVLCVVGPIIAGVAIGAIPLAIIGLIGAAAVVPFVVGGSFLIAESIKTLYEKRKLQRANQRLSSNLLLHDCHQESKIVPPLSNQTDNARNLEEKHLNAKGVELPLLEVNKSDKVHRTSKFNQSLNIDHTTKVGAMGGSGQKRTSSLNLSNFEKTTDESKFGILKKTANQGVVATKSATSRCRKGNVEAVSVAQQQIYINYHI